MTVATSTAKSGPYAGAGTTGPFTVAFPFVEATHLRVTRTSTSGVNTTLTYTTDYSVAGAGGASGTVTLVTALAVGEQLTITRNVPFTQTADYVSGDPFPAESHERQLDLACMRDQQTLEVIGRTLTLPVNSPAGISVELPAPSAGKLFGWNQSANGLANYDASDLASVIAFAAWQSQTFSGDGATIAFGLSSDPGNINNLDVSVGGDTKRPTLDYTLSGTTITFATAPAIGTNNILVRWGQALPQGTSTAGQVSYTRAAAAGADNATVARKLLDYVSVRDPDFMAASLDTSLDANVTVTTAAFTAALATGKAVYVPAGTYVVQLVSLPSGAVIFGDGPATIIKQYGAAVGLPYVFKIDGATATVANNVRNVTVRDLMVYRATRNAITSAGDSDQFTHLVGISAASEVLFERVWFKGFNGDGLYIGSGFAGGEERHNENIVVRDCVFDGVDHENRNAISVIDCRGLLVTGCAFMNCSSQYMPGAIDVEPNTDVWHVVRDIKITNNFFYNNGGSNGSVSILLSSGFTTNPSGFLIDGNTIDAGTYAQDKGILVREMGDATTSRQHDVKIVNNTLRGTTYPALLWGLNGVVVRDNTFTDTAAGMQVASNVASTKCMNVLLQGNEFRRVATAGGAGVYVFNADYVDILHNRFIDVGKTDNTFGYAIDFHTGTSTFVRVDGNRIENPSGRTTVAIQKEAGHTFTPAGNRYGENELAGLGNFFSPRPGSATYDPASLADGAGVTTTVSVAGAALGDYVEVSFSQALAGVLLTGWVSAADTVSVRFQNESGGVVDLASGTISARTRRP